MIKAKKSLGQNFLKSEGDLKAIVKAGELDKDDVVLEIGPGRGALTEKILEAGVKVMAIEKDDELTSFLSEKFEKEIKNNQLKLISGDILDEEINSKIPFNYKLISNIPYYITGQILRNFLSMENQPERMVLLVQKEVADRIIAKDGKESLLSISVKVYSEPELIKIVKAGAFYPIPKVQSAILRLNNINKEFFNNISEEKFFETLHLGFAHKRKRLFSNLKKGFGNLDVEKLAEKCNLDQNIRAEKLSAEDWGKIVENI